METIDKILLVEDQEDDQFIAKRNIKRCWPDALLLVAGNGEEAIDTLSTMQGPLPDLILLDINMPRMNGHEFLERWAEQHSYDVPVVVMLTSSDQTYDREQSEKYKFVKDYIVKPLDKATVQSLSEKLAAQP